MSLETFAVTHLKVRAHYFPQIADFTTYGPLLAATVTEMISDSAAELGGKLVAKGITPSAILLASHPQAYQWCSETVRLGAAVRALNALSGHDPEVAKAWQKKLSDRFDALEEWGAEALGDAPAATTANGPLTHINNHSLTTENTEKPTPSDVVPFFRRDDVL